MKKTHRVIAIGLGLFVSSLVYYGVCAAVFPSVFNVDGHANRAAIDYLLEHRRLPVVDATDAKIEFSQLGTTRLLRPPLTAILSASLALTLVPSIKGEVLRYKVGSVLLAALTVVIAFLSCYLLSQQVGVSVLAAILVGLLPRFVFLATGANDDIGAVFTVSLMFYAVALIISRQVSFTSLLILALAMGLIFQSKYTAWISIPCLLMVVVPLIWRAKAKIAKQMPAILIVFFIAGAWWPLWNMANYGWHDPTSLQHAAEIQAELTGGPANRRGYWSEGIVFHHLLQNHDEFLGKSVSSAIGALNWIDLNVSAGLLLFYGALFVFFLSGVAVLRKTPLADEDFLFLCVVVALILQAGFYLHHNLLRDIQPDGRYLLPMLVPVVVISMCRFNRLWCGYRWCGYRWCGSRWCGYRNSYRNKLGHTKVRGQWPMVCIGLLLIGLHLHNLAFNIAPFLSV